MERTIFKALSQVQTALARQGISKDQRNDHGKYNFRGIDDVYNALATRLSEAGVIIAPRLVKHSITKVTTSGGKPSNHAQVVMKYNIFDQHGDHIAVSFPGEAMDTSDKAVNKATTAAYKYMVFQLFCIPTESGEDADAENHQVSSTISDIELAEITRALASLDNDPQVIERLSRWQGISSLSQIEMSQYANVMEKLNELIAKRYAADQDNTQLSEQQAIEI